MNANSNWRAFTGIASSLFFCGTIWWLLLYGKPENGLHQTALSWSYVALFGIIMSVGFDSIIKAIEVMKTPPK